MGSIVHRSVPTNLKWFPTCSHAHAMFQDRFKDVQVGSRWFSTLYILSPNRATAFGATVSTKSRNKALTTRQAERKAAKPRLEAYVNTVEQSVIQRQFSLVSRPEYGCLQTPDTEVVPQSESGVSPRFQTSNHLEHPVHRLHQAGELALPSHRCFMTVCLDAISAIRLEVV